MRKTFAFICAIHACTFFNTANCDDLLFENPAYVDGVTARYVNIPNGSVINFASDGPIGAAIRAASAMNEVGNPHGLTHTGLAVNENPINVLEIVEKNLGSKKRNPIIKELNKYFSDVFASNSSDRSFMAPFCLESDGSVGEVLRGILPHAHIHALTKTVLKYDGNVYVRQLTHGVHRDVTRAFMIDYLGRDYESLWTLQELTRSVQGLNEDERTENLFCSELVALFYKKAGIINPDENVSNVIPEYFSEYAGKYDLLNGYAGPSIQLKYSFDVTNPEEDSPYGAIVRTGSKFLNRCIVL